MEPAGYGKCVDALDEGAVERFVVSFCLLQRSLVSSGDIAVGDIFGESPQCWRRISISCGRWFPGIYTLLLAPLASRGLRWWPALSVCWRWLPPSLWSYSHSAQSLT